MDELENITQILKPFGIKTKNFNLNHIYLDKKRNLQSYSVKRWRETYKKKPKLDFDEETLQSAFKTLRDFDKKHEKDFFEKGKIEKIKSDLDILFDCIQYMPPNWILEVSLQFSIVFLPRRSQTYSARKSHISNMDHIKWFILHFRS